MQLNYIYTSYFEYNQIDYLDIETVNLGILKFIAHTLNISISQETMALHAWFLLNSHKPKTSKQGGSWLSHKSTDGCISYHGSCLAKLKHYKNVQAKWLVASFLPDLTRHGRNAMAPMITSPRSAHGFVEHILWWSHTPSHFGGSWDMLKKACTMKWWWATLQQKRQERPWLPRKETGLLQGKGVISIGRCVHFGLIIWSNLIT